MSLIIERRVPRPGCLSGGEPGARDENWLLPGGDEGRAERLPDKCTIRMKAGDLLRMLTPGGGGWGQSRRMMSCRRRPAASFFDGAGGCIRSLRRPAESTDGQGCCPHRRDRLTSPP